MGEWCNVWAWPVGMFISLFYFRILDVRRLFLGLIPLCNCHLTRRPDSLNQPTILAPNNVLLSIGRDAEFIPFPNILWKKLRIYKKVKLSHLIRETGQWVLESCDKKNMFYCQHEKNVRHRLENDQVRSSDAVILITRSKVPDEKAQIFFRKVLTVLVLW